MDLDLARKNYERLELRTAQRVLQFHEMRRSMPIGASQSIGSDGALPLESRDDIDSAAHVESANTLEGALTRGAQQKAIA